MATKQLPKWLTPERKAYLVDLFYKSGGFCVYGHRPCTNPEHHYLNYIEAIIRNWVSDDIAERLAEWRAEQVRLHATADRHEPVRGMFNAVSSDIWHAEQPQHYIEALGISGLDFHPFAKVRLSSSFMRLQVSLGDSLRELSKNRKRKVIRYGKALPLHIESKINSMVAQAVSHYLAHPH